MKTFLVGGAVRDTLLGLTPKDKDYVVIGATPQQMLDAGFKQVGADFPVFLNDAGEEYALARTERKTGPGYKGFETVFDPTVTLEDDLARRDITINAMAMDDDGNIIDPFGGMQDISDGVLRHTSEAFIEDPLRVLRVARFTARFDDFNIHDSTIELMCDIVDRGEINNLTKERVWNEFVKAFSEPVPIKFIMNLNLVGALDVVFPELAAFLEENSVDWIYFDHCLSKFDTAFEKLAYVLIQLEDEQIESFFDRMKVPNEFICLVRNIRYFYNSFVETEDADAVISIVKMFNQFKVGHSMDVLNSCISFYRKLIPRIETLLDNMQMLTSAYNSISFDSLSKDEQKSLKGKEIADALNAKRIAAVEAVFDNWLIL